MPKIKPQKLLLQSKNKKGPTRISATTIFTCNVIFVLVIWSLVATYRHLSHRSSNQAGNDVPNDEDIDGIADVKKYDLPNYAIINTSKGSITVDLNKEASPEIVDKFIDLCQKGHFKGMLFQRVIKNYVIQLIQGGDVQRRGSVEDWTLREKPHTISPKHDAFMLGTSKANEDNKDFDLFITTAPIPDLNDKLIVFGRVIKGEDIVQEIEEVDTDEHYRPKSAIGVINITLKQQL